MNEIEPKQTFVGRRWEIHFWDDEEEITVALKRNKAWITGMVGPLLQSEYPKLFNDNPSQQGVDQSARQLIREMIGGSGDYGFEQCWSDGFPIERFFPYKEFKNAAKVLAELLCGYLKPSGVAGNLAPGDITQAVQTCLNDLVDPDIKVEFGLKGKELARAGGLWWKGEKSFLVEVREDPDDQFDKFFSEGHEAGHLMQMYFLEGK